VRRGETKWDKMKIQPVNRPDISAARRRSGNEDSLKGQEEELVAEAKGGSLHAFEQLVDCYAARVFRVARSLTHDRADAEEIMQDAFVRAFENLPHFQGEFRFYTWLVRIAINEGLMRTRRYRLNEISVDDVFENEDCRLPCELQDWGPSPEQRYSQKELHGILDNAISQLAPGYRMVFQLRDVEGFSTEETARSLNLSIPAVKARLCRARFRLRELLNESFKPTIAP